MLEKLKQILHISNDSPLSSVEEQPIVEKQIREMFFEMKTDVIRIQIGSDMFDFKEDIESCIADLRCKIKDETGFIIPIVRIKENNDIQENEYTIEVLEKLVFEDYVVPQKEKVIEEISKHIERICNENLDDIFTNEVMENYVEAVYPGNYYMTTQIIQYFSMASLRIILTELLRNKKSIKNIQRVFEKILEVSRIENFPCHTKDPYMISQKLCKIL